MMLVPPALEPRSHWTSLSSCPQTLQYQDAQNWTHHLPFQNFLFLLSFVPSLRTLSFQFQKSESILGRYLLSDQSLSPVSSVLQILPILAFQPSLTVSLFSLAPSAFPVSLWLLLVVFFYLLACLANSCLNPPMTSSFKESTFAKKIKVHFKIEP